MSIEAMAPASTLPRPSPRDQTLVRQAAERIAADCVGWDPTSKPEAWIEPLLRARSEWDDGFRLARELERDAYVMANFELAEILDGASRHLDDVHEEAEKAWVRIVGFEPAFAVGREVTMRHGTGPVHSIDETRARYVVDVERRGNGGIYANAEDVVAA
jgi:hypothetical protein